jgi:50S ribosomal protein L16 3-hydroxylase
MIIEKFDKDLFIKDYWQQKPCIIKGFLKDFSDPIGEEHLAGLAQELDIDSRIVSLNNDTWHVEQGPINDFKRFCKGKWTLLVQGVDKFIDNIDELTDLVSFIPHWRLDDVMVSYSVEGAGVGPHTDEYDVFILQGKGTRRWQVGLPMTVSECIPHPLLRQIEGFEPIIDHVLENGDVVYIPPKHPHNGIALEPCMNYSIGFRAPTDLELLTGIIDEGPFESIEKRYTDGTEIETRSETISSAAISASEMIKIKSELAALVNSPNAESAIVQYLSRQSLPDYDYELSGDEYEAAQNAIGAGICVYRLSGIKALYAENQASEEFEFFVNGDRFCADRSVENEIKQVIDAREIDLHNTFPFEVMENEAFVSCLMTMFESGYWDYR